jgi:hypothetical protein
LVYSRTAEGPEVERVYQASTRVGRQFYDSGMAGMITDNRDGGQEEFRMEKTEALHLLQTMIDYFEAGNQETDAAAKAILESDFDRRDHWREEIDRLHHGMEWTGLRAPEAEIVGRVLRYLQQLLAERPAQP